MGTAKTEQKLLLGKGTVEQRNKSLKMIEALANAFTRPIIGHTAWLDAITEEQKQRIQIERMKQIAIEGHKVDAATDYEAMVYLSTVSLSVPLSSMWSRIYFHLFKKFYPDKSDFIPKHEGNIKGNILAERELNKLKTWLYKQSKKAIAKPAPATK